MEHISGLVVKEMDQLKKRVCRHLTEKRQCSHPTWLLSDGRPWLACQAIKELNSGCPRQRGEGRGDVMGTNYYLYSKPPCECCGRTRKE